MCEIYLTNEEIKQELLSMLKELITVLEENNVCYFAMSGTMLGIIRHGGFIPWDDDIDIGMSREEYNRFIELLKSPKSVLPSHIKAIGFEVNAEYIPYIKIINTNIKVREGDQKEGYLWIDVFPFDNLPQFGHSLYLPVLIKCIRRMVGYRMACISKIELKRVDKNFFTRCYNDLLRFLANSIEEDRLFSYYINYCKRYQRKNSEYIQDLVWGTKKVPTELLDSFSYYLFEGVRIQGFKDYDTYLTCIYGDYMKLPPEDQRVNHGIKAWRVNSDEE